MTSPIVGRRDGMKSMKERMDILEHQFINLRDSMLSDLKKHFAVDNGNLRMVVDAEGTNNIEEYNTMEIMEDKNKTERLKEDMKDFLDKEVDKPHTNRTKVHTVMILSQLTAVSKQY